MELETWTKGAYLFSAIFGVGVTAIDLLGIWGSSDHSHDGGLEGSGGHDALEAPAVADGAPEGSAMADTHASGSAGEHDVSVFASSLMLLRYLRQAVYFSLGFGPAGLAALATGISPWASLLWALPMGIASAVVAGWVFAFQRRDVDSSVQDRDLFFQRAEVVVPIRPGEMGRVRVTLGLSVVERYACAENSGQAFQKGDEVYITRVSDSCVYVELMASAKTSG